MADLAEFITNRFDALQDVDQKLLSKDFGEKWNDDAAAPKKYPNAIGTSASVASLLDLGCSALCHSVLCRFVMHSGSAHYA